MYGPVTICYICYAGHPCVVSLLKDVWTPANSATSIFIIVPDKRVRGQPACPKIWRKYEEEIDSNNHVMYMCVTVVYKM
jgi:hypothetical protein